MGNASGIMIVEESPPFVNGLANLYKYEPFSYRYDASTNYFFSNFSTTPEIATFVTATASSIIFKSTSGYQVSYSNTFPFTFQSYSNIFSPVLRGTLSNNFAINPGRFFPPVFGASNTFYVSEAITPIAFNTCAGMSSVFANPTMIPGLTFSNVTGSGGTQWVLQGTPTAQVPTTAYQIIGTSGGRIVTTTNTYTVLGERVQLFVNNVPTASNVPLTLTLSVGIPIVSNVITASFPGTPSFTYAWNSALPNGLEFTDNSGTVISPALFSFAPTDGSRTIILQGTPSVAAAKSFASANISNYTVTLGAFQSRPGGTISNTLPIQFSFGETVLFTADPYSNLLYVNVSLSTADNIAFRANTYFSTPVSISSILSPDLRSDLSINFNFGTQTAYLVSSNGPTSVASNTFTLRARNANNITRDASLTIQTLTDSLSWVSPTPIDGCYNFILSRALSNEKTGYYPYPIEFKAVSAAGMPITYSATGFSGTTIGLSGNILSGTPLNICAFTTATITATAANTGVTKTIDVSYEIVNDVITLSSTPALPTQFQQNVAMTPVQMKATTLSGRSVTSYTGTGFPTGVSMTLAGKISGTPISDLSGAYLITANTGYASNTLSTSYSMVRDTVLFMTDSNRYYIPPGSNVPADMKYRIESFSGLAPSNAAIEIGNPTQFGVLMDSNGAFSGTMSTNIAPNPVLPQYPQWVPFNVSAQVGTAYGDTTFYMSALNANGPRQYFTAGNPPSSNLLYYSIPTNLSNAPQSVVDSNYQNWFSDFVYTPGVRATDVAVRYIDTSHSTVVVCVNDTSAGAVLRSTDGINFGNTLSILGTEMVLGTTYMSGSTWLGAGVVSGSAYLYASFDDGASWQAAINISSLKTRAGTSTAYETNGLFIARVGTSSNEVVIGGGQYTTGGAETVVLINTNPPSITSRSFAMPGEVAGALVPQSNQELYYGSELYLTACGAPAVFVDASTMVGVVSGSPVSVSGQFNFFCYDVRQASSNLFVATGVHNYGAGYVPEVRVSTNIFGPYTVTNLSTGTLFTPSATPPKPNIGYGPMFADASYVFMPVTTGGTTRIYRHNLQAPSLTNWISISSTLGNIDITQTARSPFITNSNCLPFVDFGQELGLPVPVFTAPTQTDYLFYQYIGIDPITVTAVPGVGGGDVYLMGADLPPGFSFSGATGTITGIPTQVGPQVLQIHAHDISWNTYTTLNLNINVIIPRIIRKQNGAGAYTSLLRQYTEVNGAQNARDSRVLPSQERNQGAFGAPEGPDVITQTVDPKCFDPNACN